MKYVPLCFYLLLVILGHSFVTMAVYFLIGYYQFMIRKKAILRLPLKVYRKIDSFVCDCIKRSEGYVKVTDVENSLKKVCLTRGCC